MGPLFGERERERDIYIYMCMYVILRHRIIRATKMEPEFWELPTPSIAS